MQAIASTSLRPFGHFSRRSAIGLAVIVGAATGFAVLLVLVQSGWPPLERLDREAADGLNNVFADRPVLVTGLTAVTTLGGNAVMWWLATVTAIGMLLRREPHLAGYLVVTGLGALALVPIIKLLVGRARPVVADPILTAPGNSFPSGHTVNATVFYGAVLLVFLPIIGRRFRPAAVTVVVCLVVAIGFSRAALGVHYVSDVVAGWLLGVAWLGVTVYAFQRWRVEIGLPRVAVSDGLEPEAAAHLAPTRIVPVAHPWRAFAGLVVAWVLIAGALYGFGRLVTTHAAAFDEAVPRWFAERRTPTLDAVSRFWSQAGNTHAILAIGLVIAPLAIACVHRWRPAVFLAIAMFGELGLFLVVAAVVDRPRPLVTHLDGYLPTSAFPSGHTAATVCLYGALAVIVVPRVHGFWRWATIAVAVLMPLLVATSRIYRGEHHPLDVLGGTVLALLWLTAVTIAVRPNADLYDVPAPVTTLPPPAPTPPAPTSPAPPGAADPPISVEPAAPAAAARTSPAVVANPSKMANPAARQAEIEGALARAGWPEPMWLPTTVADPGLGQARQAVAAGADLVLAAGGDGTVMSCATALAGTPVPLAVLPLGTGNLLATNLDVPSRIPAAVAVATDGCRRRLDVGVVEDRCFTVMAGMGFDAMMLHDAPAALKARIGWLAYALAALRHLCEIPMTVEIRLDGGEPVVCRARTVLIGNVGRLQGGVRLMPDAVPDDGLLDIAVLMPPRRRDWLPLAWALLRHRATVPNVTNSRAAHIEITSDQVQPRELDGDPIAPSRQMTARVRPGALVVCVPGKA
ncbi:MAG TPA: phosphatase PAP2 family protein [Micromonosporaceae bacterium]|nr:phosphatase PAP2 family protein [Micromonosporaceae bacterium]